MEYLSPQNVNIKEIIPQILRKSVKLKFIRKARYQTTKAAFCSQSSEISTQSNQNNILKFYPNYAFKDNQIDFSSRLPSQMKIGDINIDSAYDIQKFEKYNKQNAKEQQKNYSQLQQNSRAIGQIAVFLYDKQQLFNYLEPQTATFSIVEYKENDLRQIKGLTVLHVFSDENFKQKDENGDVHMEDFQKIVFVHFNETDIHRIFQQGVEKYFKMESAQIKEWQDQLNDLNQQLKNQNQKHRYILQDKIQQLYNDFEKNLMHYFNSQEELFKNNCPLFSANLDEDFLEFRKNYIKKQKEECNFQMFLDPIAKLQCLPSIDIAFINIDQNCLNFIKDKKLFPFQLVEPKEEKDNIHININSQEEHDENTQQNIVNENNYIQDISNENSQETIIYQFSNKIEKKNQKKNLKKSKNKCKTTKLNFQTYGQIIKQLEEKQENEKFVYLIGYHSNTGTVFSPNDSAYEKTVPTKSEMRPKRKPISLKLLLNSNKSVGLGKIIKKSNYIINYEGTTAFGSSGGPLLDSQGYIQGINTGSFDDITEFENIQPSVSLSLFDITVPEVKSSYKRSKNYNCAINIKHPIFKQWITFCNENSEQKTFKMKEEKDIVCIARTQQQSKMNEEQEQNVLQDGHKMKEEEDPGQKQSCVKQQKNKNLQKKNLKRKRNK